MKKSLFLFSIVVLFCSCQSGNTLKTVTIEERYSISVPSFLSEGRNLNEDASLQYQNMWKEFYVIVIDESKSELHEALNQANRTEIYSNDLKGYSELLINGFEQGISVTHKSEPIDTLINNMPAKLLTISGQVNGIDIFYSIAFIEGEHLYYQIMAWTLLDKRSQHEELMSKVIHSLVEL